MKAKRSKAADEENNLELEGQEAETETYQAQEPEAPVADKLETENLGEEPANIATQSPEIESPKTVDTVEVLAPVEEPETSKPEPQIIHVANPMIDQIRRKRQ